MQKIMYVLLFQSLMMLQINAVPENLLNNFVDGVCRAGDDLQQIVEYVCTIMGRSVEHLSQSSNCVITAANRAKHRVTGSFFKNFQVTVNARRIGYFGTMAAAGVGTYFLANSTVKVTKFVVQGTAEILKK